MKLFRYYDDQNALRTGMVCGGAYFSASAQLEEIIAGAVPAPAEPLEENSIRFAPAAVAAPEKILCVGLNYQAHQEETNLRNSAAFPPLFCKFRNSLAAHEQTLRLPESAFKFDYEVELVVIIGKTARKVSEAEAEDCIFGCTVGNDFSARDLQMATSQWLPGKACDDFAPVGPCIVTKDELDLGRLSLSCRVNGEERQRGNTADMIFSCAQIIHRISQTITLVPGDMIFTGTPSGVILGKPADHQVWLRPGDTVEVCVEGIGTLRNRLG